MVAFTLARAGEACTPTEKILTHCKKIVKAFLPKGGQVLKTWDSLAFSLTHLMKMNSRFPTIGVPKKTDGTPPSVFAKPVSSQSPDQLACIE